MASPRRGALAAALLTGLVAGAVVLGPGAAGASAPAPGALEGAAQAVHAPGARPVSPSALLAPEAAGWSNAAPNGTSIVAEVRFLSDGLDRAVVGVRPGDTVAWRNADLVGHNTTHLPPAGEPPEWNAYEILPGDVYTHTFRQAGTFRYFDFFDPDNAAFQGVVIVASGDIPPTPTRGPTNTPGPTPTSPPPTATMGATATPTATPVTLTGNLMAGGDCDADAALRVCGTGEIIALKAGYDLGGYVGLDVRVDGTFAECPGGSKLLNVASLQPLGQPCSDPTATPMPTETPAQGADLALGGRVTTSMEIPGYPGSSLTDGDPRSLWYAAADTAWAYVDLGADRTFNQITLDWSTPYGVSYGLYVWDPSRSEWAGLYWTEVGRGAAETVSLRPTYGRYVLVYAVRSTSAQGGYALSAFSVYGRERPNLALGSAVVASGSQPGDEPWYAVDGDARTGWASPPGQSNPWLQIHLPGATEISELRLWWDAFAYPTTYSLVFYDRGAARQLIVPDAQGGLFRLEFPVRPMVADTLLIYAHRVSGAGIVGLGEVELYGPRLLIAGEGPPPSQEPAGDAAEAGLEIRSSVPSYWADNSLVFPEVGATDSAAGAAPSEASETVESIGALTVPRDVLDLGARALAGHDLASPPDLPSDVPAPERDARTVTGRRVPISGAVPLPPGLPSGPRTHGGHPEPE